MGKQGSPDRGRSGAGYGSGGYGRRGTPGRAAAVGCQLDSDDSDYSDDGVSLAWLTLVAEMKVDSSRHATRDERRSAVSLLSAQWAELAFES